MQSALRSLVNTRFRGKDHYDAVRTTVFYYLVVRVLWKVRKICQREGLRRFLVDLFVPYLKRLPPVRRKLLENVKETSDSMGKVFSEEVCDPRLQLPAKGLGDEQIRAIMDERTSMDNKHWTSGKCTGAVYHGELAHHRFIGEVYAKWAFTNPLHPSIHPALRQMDSEVVRMVINMYNGGPECCGCFTTGGTESILMAMKSYRDWGRAEKGIWQPNIVICTSAHAAFLKAGDYFGIFVKQARMTEEGEIDLAHLQRLMDRDTVAIVGSCCQFAQGTIDPIEKMAEIARKRGVGLHVDCCLGGFLVPFMEKAGFEIPRFDFRVPGVTSISCDPHKYGFAPKGASVVMFSSRELRHHMYSFAIEWSGGIYATPTMTGSRAGGPVAATWASMCRFGLAGYVETTRRIVGCTREIAEGIRAMPELRIVGRPDVSVVAFDAAADQGFSCYAIADCMKKKNGWDLATCQNPASVHMAVTLTSSGNAKLFLTDLKSAVEELKTEAGRGSYNSTAGMYGMAATLPAGFLQDVAAVYLDAMNETYEGSKAGAAAGGEEVDRAPASERA
eukprot:TRINITY_DN15646_c0_g1_i1.p1 TRINITY_DN15646_c0_g1~~TRINITY_DN15646_c0_g1_i1.p1  ORF type:complete len:575 (-),score=116.49 TRINITY_DN15646_c0_g1_i1:317-1993(-)